MWDNDTEDLKENTGNYSRIISVGEILQSLARVYPAANEYRIGESLMQATLMVDLWNERSRTHRGRAA